MQNSKHFNKYIYIYHIFTSVLISHFKNGNELLSYLSVKRFWMSFSAAAKKSSSSDSVGTQRDLVLVICSSSVESTSCMETLFVVVHHNCTLTFQLVHSQPEKKCVTLLQHINEKQFEERPNASSIKLIHKWIRERKREKEQNRKWKKIHKWWIKNETTTMQLQHD